MLRSRVNALKSVRQVTQENNGKLTPGVDRIVVKTVQERAELVDRLMSHQPWRASPVRRVYIPKASGKLRPLGVPTVLDRAMQAMVKNALEPYWEARFEPCSYGFRPGRGCHEASAESITSPHQSGDVNGFLTLTSRGRSTTSDMRPCSRPSANSLRGN